MALIYSKYCVICRQDTTWMKSDMGERVGTDNCNKCGKSVFDWANMRMKRLPKSKKAKVS